MGRKKLFSKEEVLKVIHNYVLQHGIPPIIEELRDLLGAGSTRTVLRYLRWLQDDGEIKRWSGARGMQLARAPESGVETTLVPVAGGVPAGSLTLAEENIDGWVRLPIEFVKPRSAKFFLLRVRGDSMNKAEVNGEQVEDTDLVLVQQQAVAQPGDIAVVLVDGEATVKRLRKGTGYYVLQPESTNTNHYPIVLTEDFAVQGVVRRVFKNGSELLNRGWE